MDQQQNLEFTNFLREKAAEAQRDTGYPANAFLAMLNQMGGFGTAVHLVSAKRPSPGYTRLWELERLDLSVEAAVVETAWRRYFSPSLLALAERRLTEFGYSFTRYRAEGEEENMPSAAGSDEGPPTLPAAVKAKRRSTQRSFSEHCEFLGAPLKNRADRWCALSRERRFAVFTVWADKLVDGEYVFWDDAVSPSDTRRGARELGQVIQEVMANGYDAYGILCEAKDPMAKTRKRGHFVEDVLLVLRFQKEAPGVVAHLQGEISVTDFRADRRGELVSFPSANHDLDAPPMGSSSPGRVERIASGYRRDDAVRRYVLAASKGRCEYCDRQGFELPNGERYLEAHHVQPLGRDGPDTVDNVIALCPEHHREAHYGRNWEALEQQFREKLAAMPRSRLRLETRLEGVPTRVGEFMPSA